MGEDDKPAILLARMPQQTEVRVQEDDWTGKTDAAARRKLQNRLNQRIWRKIYPAGANQVFYSFTSTSLT